MLDATSIFLNLLRFVLCTAMWSIFESVPCAHTMEFYAVERKKDLIPFATAWMELESIMLSEISQAVRDKYHMISPLTGT